MQFCARYIFDAFCTFSKGTIYASGGEDGLVCLWSADQSAKDQQLPSSSHVFTGMDSSMQSMDGAPLDKNHGPMKRQNNVTGKQFRKQAPY
jgi:hypothetical protein